MNEKGRFENPYMAQFGITSCIAEDYVFIEEDKYKHSDYITMVIYGINNIKALQNKLKAQNNEKSKLRRTN
ncbi:hypothetical protein [Ructibacterium gallinarum]|uniref:hypothetical protein n=1 Tax=Ructibacterium gallinarum TaxID=2779355 RepID=UPI001CF7FEE2|nr:hypothetical protein [Ructibacterium gallinarum]